MTYLSDRIRKLSESQTIAMAQRSRELKASGLDIISLSLGEPDFNTPLFIQEAAHQAIRDNYSHYMPVPGYADLREAISQKIQRDNGLHYPPSQIVVSTGAKQSLANAMLCLLNPGDEVLLPAPYWVTYMELVKLCGAVPVIIEAGIEDDFKVTAEQLEQHISSKTKLLLYSSPCNPSGSVYSKEELGAFADVIASHEGLFVLSDEIYEYINYSGGHQSIAQFENVKDRAVIVNGVSKAYAMTGWRVGYMAGPRWISDACIKMQGQFTSGTCGIAQQAAKAAIAGDNAEVFKMRDIFRQRRDMVLQLIKDIPGLKANVPQGAFYIFPDVSAYFGKRHGERLVENASELCLYLLDEAHVALVTGSAFGNDNCIRISYAASKDELTRAMDRIRKALGKLS